jgi:hypothetical protein
VAREFASRQLFCARIAGASLMRRTGWVYAKANRVPRAVQEVMAAFERIKPRLKLTPAGSRSKRPAAAPPAPTPSPAPEE